MSRDNCHWFYLKGFQNVTDDPLEPLEINAFDKEKTKGKQLSVSQSVYQSGCDIFSHKISIRFSDKVIMWPITVGCHTYKVFPSLSGPLISNSFVEHQYKNNFIT